MVGNYNQGRAPGSGHSSTPPILFPQNMCLQCAKERRHLFKEKDCILEHLFSHLAVVAEHVREAHHGFQGVDFAAHFGVADVHHLGGGNNRSTHNADSTRDKEDEEQEVKENTRTVGTKRRLHSSRLSEMARRSCRCFRVLQLSHPSLSVPGIGVYRSTF